ncbi:MAG: hypothetical protein ACI83D_000630 [Planctomycetota bacterium]|jgi:hypothetical protein
MKIEPAMVTEPCRGDEYRRNFRVSSSRVFTIHLKTFHIELHYDYQRDGCVYKALTRARAK